MSNSEEQMKILRDKVLAVIPTVDQHKSILRALASYGRNALPYLAEIVSRSTDADVIQSTEYYISRINQGFTF